MITAVVVEKRKVAEVVKTYGGSRSWLSELLALNKVKGDAALEPKSVRSKSVPNAISPAAVELIIKV